MKYLIHTIKGFCLIFMLVLTIQSCRNKPTILEPIIEETINSDWNIESSENEIHKVLVEDILQASKYTYLYVNEDDRSYWMTIPSSTVAKGETYYYKGGIKMSNFKSKEHDRVFEELYLVGGVSTSPTLSSQPGLNAVPATNNTEVVPQDITPVAGGISLKDLFSDPQKYNGQSVIIKGQCVKVNRQIMGRNWIHLQDGNKDDNDTLLDLTVTTDQEIALGSVITLEGRIVLDKDFGAGYRYAVLMEEAKIK